MLELRSSQPARPCAGSQRAVLASAQVTDPNGNVSAVRFDALGRVVAMALMGKPGAGEGDTLDDPTVTFDYDLDRFRLTGKPNVVHSRARERHGAANPRWQEAYSYSDGAGREILRKVQAEPGLAPLRDEGGALVHDEQGKLVFAFTAARWVGTGRTVLDNKGSPVKQYEPFFSSTHEFEDESELVEWGITPILHYDPIGRLVLTDLPDGTFSKVTFNAWKQTSYDPNDTVLLSSWYAERALLPQGTPERRTAELAAAHADTPTVSHLDALAGFVIGYEEYHPFGTTAYWSASSATEVSRRRYRYTGNEKDEETGLYYHGARYYAPWLGRWTAADPVGMADGTNLYSYARGNPVRLYDRTGASATSSSFASPEERRVAEAFASRGEGSSPITFEIDILHANVPTGETTASPTAAEEPRVEPREDAQGYLEYHYERPGDAFPSPTSKMAGMTDAELESWAEAQANASLLARQNDVAQEIGKQSAAWS
jgi:RHS repeat-associated protein